VAVKELDERTLHARCHVTVAASALWLDAVSDPEMIVVLHVTDRASVATDAW
jgi:hypothetical protein